MSEPVRDDAQPAAPGEPVRPIKLYASGGQTLVNDYLMSDGSVKAMTLREAKAAGYGAAPPPSTQEVRPELPLQYEDGPDYCTVRDAQGKDFALTMRPELMKAMEAALAAQPAAPVGEPVAWRYWDTKSPYVKWHLSDTEPANDGSYVVERLGVVSALAAQPAAPVGEPVAMLEKLWSQTWDKRPPGDPKDTYRELRALLAAPPPSTHKVRAVNPEEIWEQYLDELRADGGKPSPQGAMAFAIAALSTNSTDIVEAEIRRWESDDRILYPDSEVLASLERIRASLTTASGQERYYCPTCWGDGKVKDHYQVMKCPDCDGTGIEPDLTTASGGEAVAGDTLYRRIELGDGHVSYEPVRYPDGAATPPEPTKEDFAKWARVWHDTCETIMTLLDLPGGGSPQEMLAQVQARDVAQATPEPGA